MEVCQLLQDLLAWQPEYEARVAEKAWGRIREQLLAWFDRLEKVHKARCNSGDPVLREVCDDLLQKIASKLAPVRLVNPGGTQHCHNLLLQEAEKAKEGLASAWDMLDIGHYAQAQEELERLLELEIRLRDIADTLWESSDEAMEDARKEM